MKNFTNYAVIVLFVMLGVSCSKEETTPQTTYQGGSTGFSLPLEMKDAELQFYINTPNNDATCEGLFAHLVNDNQTFVLEICNPSTSELVQGLIMDSQRYKANIEFLQVSYTCEEEYHKSGSPGTQPVIQVDVEKAIITSIEKL